MVSDLARKGGKKEKMENLNVYFLFKMEEV